MCSACGCQKRSSDCLELELQMVIKPSRRCWQLNLTPLKEQQEFFTTEPSLQPQNYHFMHVSALPAYMSVSHMHAWRSAEGVRSLWTGVIDGCELSCGC